MKKNSKIALYFIVISLLFISLFIFNTNSIEKFQASSLDNTEYDIIIIAGQSNAIGQGMRNVCDSTALPGCSTGINLRNNSTREGVITDINRYDFIDMTKIRMFTSPNEPDQANRNKIVGMREPLQHFQHRPRFTNSNRLSFASSFAKDYISRTNIGSRKVLIVGCAWSGSSMLISSTTTPKWKKDNDNDTNSIHSRTVERLRTVRNLLTANNPSKVVAFLWHQGESDTTRIFNVPSSDPTTRISRENDYKSALNTTLTGMRREIMTIFNSAYTYPILLAGLSYDRQFNRITNARIPLEYREEMSLLIKEVSDPTKEYYIPKSAFVSTDRLNEGGFNRRLEGNSKMTDTGNIIGPDDNSHFSASSTRELGRRYFYYYNLIK